MILEMNLEIKVFDNNKYKKIKRVRKIVRSLEKDLLKESFLEIVRPKRDAKD